MFDFDKWHEIWATLSRHKLRTFLTALGVVWGVFMLVLAVALAGGLKTGVTKQMSGTATNSVFLWGGRTTLPFQGMQPGRWIQFEDADIAAVARVEGIELLAPRISVGGWSQGITVTRGGETGSFRAMGDFPEYRRIQNMDMLSGRFLDPLDLTERRKVAVIGVQVRDVLFPSGEEAVGQHINLRGAWYLVIGVFKPNGEGDDADRQAQTLMIPFTTAQQAFNMQNRVSFFTLTVDRGVPAITVEDRVRTVLAQRHKLHPDDREAFGSFNWAEEFNKIRLIFVGIQVLTWVIGLFTLLAGVLGVSNILLISVKERTKEIGVRKALGATPASVVWLVLQESIVLTTVSGYLGLLLAVTLVEVAGLFTDWSGPLARPELDFSIAIVSIAILVVSGAVAGLIPARHAARIPPVEALRAEQ